MVIKVILCLTVLFSACSRITCEKPIEGRVGCSLNEMLQCSMPLPLLSSTNTSIAVTPEELDKDCRQSQVGMDCINNYTTRCMDAQEKRSFLNMYSIMPKVIADLCNPGKYRDDYLKHAPCLKQVRPEYEMCSKTYELALNKVAQENSKNLHNSTEINPYQHEEHLRTICCSFQEYLLCSEQTVQRTCGDDTAVFTSVHLKRMATNIIKTYCLEYRGLECGMPGNAPSLAPTYAVLSSIVTPLITLLLAPGGST